MHVTCNNNNSQSHPHNLNFGSCFSVLLIILIIMTVAINWFICDFCDLFLAGGMDPKS